MQQNSHIKSFLKNWPRRQAFAAELSAVLVERGIDPVAVDRVHKWARTGSIPAPFWSAIIATAALRGVTVTADQLAEWHEIQPATLETAGQ